MKTIIFAVLFVLFIIEFQIFMLLRLDGLNLELWKSQVKYNNAVSGIIGEATSTTR